MRTLVLGLLGLLAMPAVASAGHHRSNVSVSVGFSQGWSSHSSSRGQFSTSIRFGYNSRSSPVFNCRPPVFISSPRVIYSSPVYCAPTVVYRPAPVVCQPAPVVVYQSPVVCQSAVVYGPVVVYQPAPVIYRSVPAYSYPTSCRPSGSYFFRR
jgi:hypothetical protein